MPTTPTIDLIDIGSAAGIAEADQERLDSRTQILQTAAPYFGVGVSVVNARDVLAASPTRPAPDAAWWLGPVMYRPELDGLWTQLTKAYPELVARGALHEPPGIVDETHDLSKSYPLLERAGVPQPESVFIALTSDEIGLAPEDLRALLRVRTGPLSFGRRGFFVRTNFGTLKAMFMNFAGSTEAAIDRGLHAIVSLRPTQPIGGLVLREAAPIALFANRAGDILIAQELRVFVCSGIPVYWGVHASIDLLHERLGTDEVEELSTRFLPKLAEIRRVAQAAGGALRSRFLTADIALLDDGSVLLVEVNPGCFSGWPCDLVLLGAHGRFVAQILQQPLPTADEVLAVADSIKISTWGYGKLHGDLT